MTKKQTASPLHMLFHLAQDQEHAEIIDRDIRDGVRVAGTNLWVLFFAILIASIGLNVNSTAAIIGAMLISPLMGPIVGMGYGAGVGDIGLIRLAARNMLVFIILSLATSALYFLITPLNEAQSELLARTQPNLWDVLIAFFGGSAGIVALTRKEVSNVIPGVAIATALMPPLCTAGYALAHGHWSYLGGAIYLFAINCVFIAFATLLFVKLMKLPRRGRVSESMLRWHRIVIVSVIAIVMIPSGFLAMQLVEKEVLNTRINSVLHHVQSEDGVFVLRRSVDEKTRQIRLIFSGEGDAEAMRKKLAGRFQAAGIPDTDVRITYAGGSNDWDLYQQAKAGVSVERANWQNRFNTLLAAEAEAAVLRELRALYPEAVKIGISRGHVWQRSGSVAASDEAVSAAVPAASGRTAAAAKTFAGSAGDTAFIRIVLPQPLSEAEHRRLRAWLTERMLAESVELDVRAMP